MRLLSYLLGLLSLITFVAALADQNGDAGTTQTTSTARTTVWVTITTNGALATVQTIYSQLFMSTYTNEVSSYVQQGSIGLGSLSGTVGGTRTYTSSTINGGEQVSPYSSGLVGALFVLLGYII